MGISPFYRELRERVGSSLLFIPSVAALIRDDNGRLLVHQRPDKTWSLPAGAIEPGETPAQAVVREALEETGYQIFPERVAAVVGGESCRVRSVTGHEIEYLVTVFECRIVGRQPHRCSDETIQIAFLPQDEVMARVVFKLPDAAYDGNRPTTFFQGCE